MSDQEMDTQLNSSMEENFVFGMSLPPGSNSPIWPKKPKGSVKSTKSLYFTNPDTSGTMARDEEMTLDIYDIYSDDPGDPKEHGGKIHPSETILTSSESLNNNDVFVTREATVSTQGSAGLTRAQLSDTVQNGTVTVTQQSSSKVQVTSTKSSTQVNGIKSSSTETSSSKVGKTSSSKKQKAPPPPVKGSKKSQGAFKVKSAAGKDKITRTSSSGSMHDDKFKQALSGTLERKIQSSSSANTTTNSTSTPQRQESVPGFNFAPGSPLVSSSPQKFPGDRLSGVSNGSTLTEVSALGVIDNKESDKGHTTTTTSRSVKVDGDNNQVENVVGSRTVVTQSIQRSSGGQTSQDVTKTVTTTTEGVSGHKPAQSMVTKDTKTETITATGQASSGSAGKTAQTGAKKDGPGKFQMRFKEGTDTSKTNKSFVQNQKLVNESIKQASNKTVQQERVKVTTSQIITEQQLKIAESSSKTEQVVIQNKRLTDNNNLDNLKINQSSRDNDTDTDTISISSTSTVQSLLKDESFKAKISGLMAGGKKPDSSTSAPSSLDRRKKKYKFQLTEIPLEEMSPRDPPPKPDIEAEKKEDFESSTFPRDNKSGRRDSIVLHTPTSPYEEMKKTVGGGTVGRLAKDLFKDMPLTGRAIDPSTLERKRTKSSDTKTPDSSGEQKKFKFLIEGIDIPESDNPGVLSNTSTLTSVTHSEVSMVTDGGIPAAPPLSADMLKLNNATNSSTTEVVMREKGDSTDFSEDVSSLRRMEKKGFSYILDHKLAADIKKRAGDFTARKPHEAVEEKVKGQQLEVAQRSERESVILVEAKAKLQKKDSFSVENKPRLEPTSPESTLLIQAKSKLNKSNSIRETNKENTAPDQSLIRSSILLEAKSKLQKQRTEEAMDTSTVIESPQKHSTSLVIEHTSPAKQVKAAPQRETTNVNVNTAMQKSSSQSNITTTKNVTVVTKTTEVANKHYDKTKQSQQTPEGGTTSTINTHASAAKISSNLTSTNDPKPISTKPAASARVSAQINKQANNAESKTVSSTVTVKTEKVATSGGVVPADIKRSGSDTRTSRVGEVKRTGSVDQPDSAYHSDNTISPTSNYKTSAQWSGNKTSTHDVVMGHLTTEESQHVKSDVIKESHGDKHDISSIPRGKVNNLRQLNNRQATQRETQNSYDSTQRNAQSGYDSSKRELQNGYDSANQTTDNKSKAQIDSTDVYSITTTTTSVSQRKELDDTNSANYSTREDKEQRGRAEQQTKSTQEIKQIVRSKAEKSPEITYKSTTQTKETKSVKSQDKQTDRISLGSFDLNRSSRKPPLEETDDKGPRQVSQLDLINVALSGSNFEPTPSSARAAQPGVTAEKGPSQKHKPTIQQHSYNTNNDHLTAQSLSSSSSSLSSEESVPKPSTHHLDHGAGRRGNKKKSEIRPEGDVTVYRVENDRGRAQRRVDRVITEEEHYDSGSGISFASSTAHIRKHIRPEVRDNYSRDDLVYSPGVYSDGRNTYSSLSVPLPSPSIASSHSTAPHHEYTRPYYADNYNDRSRNYPDRVNNRTRNYPDQRGSRQREYREYPRRGQREYTEREYHRENHQDYEYPENNRERGRREQREYQDRAYRKRDPRSYSASREYSDREGSTYSSTIPRDHPDRAGYPERYHRDPDRGYPERDRNYPDRDRNYPVRDPHYQERDPNYPERDRIYQDRYPERGYHSMDRPSKLAPLSIHISPPEDGHRTLSSHVGGSRPESRTPQASEAYSQHPAPTVNHGMFRMSQAAEHGINVSVNDNHRQLSRSCEHLAFVPGPDRMRGREESFNSQSTGPRSPPGRYLRVDESNGGRVPVYTGMAVRDLEGFEYSSQAVTGGPQQQAGSHISRVSVDGDPAQVGESAVGVSSGKYSVHRVMERRGLTSQTDTHPDLQNTTGRKRRVYEVSRGATHTLNSTKGTLNNTRGTLNSTRGTLNSTGSMGIQTLNANGTQSLNRVRSPDIRAVDPRLQQAGKSGNQYNISLKLNAIGGQRPDSSQSVAYDERYEEHMNSLNNNTLSSIYHNKDGYDTTDRTTHTESYDRSYDTANRGPGSRQMTLVKLKDNTPDMEGQYTANARFKVRHDGPEVLNTMENSKQVNHQFMIKSVNPTDRTYVSTAAAPSPNSPISPSQAPRANNPNNGEAPRFTMTVNQTMTMDYQAPGDGERPINEDPIQPAARPNNAAPAREPREPRDARDGVEYFRNLTVTDSFQQAGSARRTPVDEKITASRAPKNRRVNDDPYDRLGEIEDAERRRRQHVSKKQRRHKMNGDPGDDLAAYLSPAEDGDEDTHSGEIPQVVRGSILIKNAIDTTGGPKVIDVVEGDDSDDEIIVEDNVNMFHGSYFQSRENPLYSSDPDLSKYAEASGKSRQPQFTRIFDDYKDIKVNRATDPVKPRRSREHASHVSSGQDTTDAGFSEEWEETRHMRTHGGAAAPSRARREVRTEQRSEHEVSRLLQGAPQGSIKQSINVEREEEDIIGPLPSNHADGSPARPEDMLNFDTVSEKVDMGLREGWAEVAVKVRCERIVPIRGVEDMFKKSSVIVTRLIEIDLLATDERRQLWENIMRRSNQGAIKDGASSRSRGRGDAKLSTKDTFNLYKTFMGLAEADEAGKRERMRIDRRVEDERRPELYADTAPPLLPEVEEEDELRAGYNTDELDQRLEESLGRDGRHRRHLEPDNMSYRSATSETHGMLY